jgi:Flp pilus assembly protein TadG
MGLSSFRRSERGAAMVEFAIVLPVLVLLVGGIIDLGRLLYTYNNLTSAVREGARLAAVLPDPQPNDPRVIARVRQWNFPGKTGNPNVSVTLDAAQPNTQFVTVTITSYQFTWLSPLRSLGNVTTWPTSAFRWEGAQGP